jgi:hypothetical protein
MGKNMGRYRMEELNLQAFQDFEDFYTSKAFYIIGNNATKNIIK